MPETPNAEPITQDDVIKNLDAFFGTTPEGDDEEDDKTAKGGGNEPKSGESESDEEQDEAESESDDEPEDAEEESDDEKPARFRFKANGADVEATLEELTGSYSREADYTRKTQAHAEEVRKWTAERDESLKAEKTALAAEREQYKAVLGVWEKQLGQALGVNEDWDTLRQQNPGEWSAKMTERYDMQNRLSAIQAESARLAEADKATQETARKQRVSSEAQKLIDAVPEWKDAAKWKEDGAQIYAYAAKYGISEKELNDIADHRVMRVLHDAARYKALQEKKPAAIKRVETAKPLPPGNASTQPLSPASRLNKLADIQSRRGDKASTVALFETLLR